MIKIFLGLFESWFTIRCLPYSKEVYGIPTNIRFVPSINARLRCFSLFLNYNNVFTSVAGINSSIEFYEYMETKRVKC